MDRRETKWNKKATFFACRSLSRSTELHKDMVASWLPWILFCDNPGPRRLYPPIWGTHTAWHKTCLSPPWFLWSSLAQVGIVKKFSSIHPLFSIETLYLTMNLYQFLCTFLGGTLWDGLRKCLCGCEGVNTGFCVCGNPMSLKMFSCSFKQSSFSSFRCFLARLWSSQCVDLPRPGRHP